MSKRVVLIEGCRTPFLKSGTGYMDLMSYELGKFAIQGLLKKTGIDPAVVERVIMGTTISNVKTGNVARESAITAGIPEQTPCHTVTQACISANQAIASGCDAIRLGHVDVVIAGGTDSISDAPIMFPKPMRKKLFQSQKMKGIGDTLKFIFSLRPSDFKPEAPAVAEFLTQRTMGNDCERLVGRYQIPRRDQDVFAARSHQLAAKAEAAGLLQKEITPITIKPSFMPIEKDNGIRGDSTAEKMGKLKPAFDKHHGTLTAANSSFLTDGATAVLLMSEDKALALGLKPKAVIVDYVFSASRLEDELLLGPAYSIGKILKKNQWSVSDFDVVELHEAFAGQVLTNLKCLADAAFCRQQLGWDQAVGEIPMERINTWGGSLALGHPFGATGARLLTTAANRLHHEGGKRALLSACAAGAHGHAMIIEKY